MCYKKFSALMIIASFFASSCFSEEIYQIQPKEAKLIREKLKDQIIGGCKSEREFVGLKNIYFLQNREIIQERKNGYSLLSIEGETFRIEKYTPRDVHIETLVFDISMEILSRTKGDKDIDIELDFVLLGKDNRIGIFWKETFLHQSYRQGIFKLDNEKLLWFCEGRGGIDSSH